jgi:TAG lipase / steryl ester hydrolase / phospholipase A2 / LPA acyltransferase
MWEMKKLERSMGRAGDQAHWRELAAEHDRVSGADSWRQREDGELFDARQIRSRYHRLRERCEEGDTEEVLFALNEGIHGNMGGMGKPILYKQSKLGTKVLIEDYVSTLEYALRQVAAAPEAEIPFDDKLDFFRRASHCFGRSALTLSGGSGLIYFHHGVVHSLLEADLLPKVISGSSAGAWMCAQLGTMNDEQLRNHFLHKRYDFNNDLSAGEMLGLLSGRNRSEVENERDEVIDAFVGNQTFQEAYEHTGRYINISIAPYERHQTSRLMNAIASPNVTIRSAVRASSSVPGMVEPVGLEAKDSRGRIKPYLRNRLWVDGSFSEDLPFKRLSRLFGVNHYIVSMINPMAVPFLREDPKTAPDSVRKSMRSLYFQALKESIKTARRWAAPGIRNRADAMLGMVYQLMDQDYSGDINIVMNTAQIRPRHLTFNYKGEDDIQGLIQAGQRAAWPKIDQIRNATLVSRVVDELLTELEQDAVANKHTTHKAHMTL